VSQTFSAVISIIFGVGLFAWTCIALQKTSDRNQKISRSLWVSEYKAHACGRALAAITNFHAHALQAAKKHPRTKTLFAVTDNFFRKSVAARYADEFQITSEHCLDIRSLIPAAELYLRNSDEENPDTPNYTYRLTETNFNGEPNLWK
jgi:hypothetical protein